ncbi:LmeA family phospholipid-binding protein [Streptomyces sp. NPDC005209]|uniref:LmeA family phospholipid-binding protein n=1 Tax=Streptomyces sp. NPDC005209 TaxID=3156715 RepID=UPI0033A6CCC1
MNRRRKIVVLVAGAAALAVAAVCATDLVVEHQAEQRVADVASCRLKPEGPVRADLTTPLAGLRALGGDVGDVTVKARRVRHEDVLMDIDVSLKDVTTDGASGGGTATATIGYDQLNHGLGTLGDGLTPSGRGGDLILGGTVGQLGLPVTVRATVSAHADRVTVTPTTVTVLGRSVAVDDLTALPAASGLKDELKPRTVAVSGLPRGVELTSARAADNGLALNFSIAGRTALATGERHGKGCAAA